MDISGMLDGEKASFQIEEMMHIPPEYHLVEKEIRIKVEGIITELPGFFLLEGTVSTELPCCCDNCLAPVTLPVSFQLNEKFTNQSIEEDEELWFFPEKILDFTEAVYTNVLLNIPPKVVCAEDCKGLCPHCGVNRNQVACDCHNSYRDSKFADLNALFDQNKEV